MEQREQVRKSDAWGGSYSCQPCTERYGCPVSHPTAVCPYKEGHKEQHSTYCDPRSAANTVKTVSFSTARDAELAEQVIAFKTRALRERVGALREGVREIEAELLGATLSSSIKDISHHIDRARAAARKLLESTMLGINILD